jgi:predicted permease
MDTLLQDLRHAVRQLRAHPGFTTVAVLTLALAIGANSMIFSAVNAVLLRPLPYREPDRLVRVYSLMRDAQWTMSPPDFTDFRRETRSFTDLAAMNATSLALSGDAPAEQVPGAQVTDGLFEILGVEPAQGRAFTAEDLAPGKDGVAIVGHGLWQRRFGASPALVGSAVRLDGRSYTVIGIMPPGFAYPEQAELWVPLAFTPGDLTTQRGAQYLDVVGRLRDGTSLDQAITDVRTVAARLETTYPQSNAQKGAVVTTLAESIVGDVDEALLILLGAVGLLLLVACANVANLQLVRAVGRGRELAIRAALGAGRARLARALLTESLVLALLGGAAGLAIAVWGIDLLARLEAVGIPRLAEVSTDARVLVFTLAASLATGIIFGVVPALQATAAYALTQRLKDAGGGVVSARAGARARNALVVVEIGLAVMLLVGAGLLLRSFLHLQRTELGFDTRGILSFQLSLPDNSYGDPLRAQAYIANLLTEVDALPGVQSAGAIFGLPLTPFGFSISVHAIDGRSLPPEEWGPSPQVRIVTPEFFRTLGIAVLRGRGFMASDRIGAPPVVVLNESAAKLIWPDGDALGRRFSIGTRMGLGGDRLGGEVIGIVPDIRARGPVSAPQPTAYFAHFQFPVGFMAVAVRTAGDPGALIQPTRQVVVRADPDVPMFRVRTMDELASAVVAQPRLYSLLLGVFAAVAVLLAAVGIYGVMAQAVARRTPEIGLRLALGAEVRDVLRMVVGDGLRLAAWGVAFGVAGAVVASQLLVSLLHGVRPLDPATFVTVPLVLLAVALAASVVPARRAAVVDPMVALRTE